MKSTLIQRLANESVASVARRLNLRYRLARVAQKESRLPQDLQQRLEQMRADNRASGEPFRAKALWSEVSRIFDREFYLRGIDNVESQYFNVRFFGYAPGDHRLFDYLIHTYLQLVQQRDSLGLLSRLKATCPVGQGLAYEIDGKVVSLDLLVSIDDFYNLMEAQPAIQSEPVVVADIGAGWGRLGYVIKKVNPRAAYLVFDLPETLLVSSTYLPRLLPDLPSMAYGSDQRQVIDRKSLLEGGMWFFGAQDIMRLADGSIDVVANIASFQEMTLDQVRAYFDIIDKKAKGGVLYLRELWSSRTHSHHLNEIENWEQYPFSPRWEQLFLRNTRLSHLFFETAYRLR